MKVSLVTGTLGARSDRFAVLLNSLASGTHRDIELIVVDQSQEHNHLSALLSEHRWFPILHLRSKPGLSRARNVGLAEVTGDIVAFPDDDSWYPETLLSSVVQRFRSDPSLGGLAGRPVDAEGHSSFPRWDLRPGRIDRFNVWRRCNSNALFLSRAAVGRVGEFDESLGVGSGTPWGAAEDIDYPLRVLAAGLTLHYDPTLLVHHPRITPSFDPASAARAESYGRGMGRVLRKHGYPWWFVLYQGARPLGGALISAATGRLAKARYHRAVLRGRRQGWRTGD
jgi:glycosyltransferase involved in cell wall biosynthesis